MGVRVWAKLLLTILTTAGSSYAASPPKTVSDWISLLVLVSIAGLAFLDRSMANESNLATEQDSEITQLMEIMGSSKALATKTLRESPAFASALLNTARKPAPSPTRYQPLPVKEDPF